MLLQISPTRESGVNRYPKVDCLSSQAVRTDTGSFLSSIHASPKFLHASPNLSRSARGRQLHHRFRNTSFFLRCLNDPQEFTIPRLITMADHRSCLPLSPSSVKEAHSIIKPHIHRTPLLTSATLDRIASTPSGSGAPAPKFRLFFKCENYQKIGAFKARGAFHAVKNLIKELGIQEVRRRGVVTHSSGMAPLALHALVLTVLLLTVCLYQETMPKPWRLPHLPSRSLAT